VAPSSVFIGMIHDRYANDWRILFKSSNFKEKSSLIFYSLFPRRVICSPAIEVEPSLTNVDTSIRGLSDGCSRPFGEYEHDIAHEKNATSGEIEKNDP